MGPWVAAAGVEVDEQVIRPLDVGDPGRPRVQVDAAEVGDPGEAGGVVDDREVRGPPAGELDRVRLEPVRVRDRHALLVEEVAIDPVRVAQHLHHAPAHVWHERRRDGNVVVDQVSFRQTALGEEDLVPVRDGHVPAGDLHGRRMTHHAASRRRGGST